jgi:hypothetical protein
MTKKRAKLADMLPEPFVAAKGVRLSRLALLGHPEMSAFRALSGAKQTSRIYEYTV